MVYVMRYWTRCPQNRAFADGGFGGRSAPVLGGCHYAMPPRTFPWRIFIGFMAAHWLECRRGLFMSSQTCPFRMHGNQGEIKGINSMGQTEPNSQFFFADFRRFSLFLGSTASRRCRISQRITRNRRFSQKTTGNRRFLQKPVCPIWFVFLHSVLGNWAHNSGDDLPVAAVHMKFP